MEDNRVKTEPVEEREGQSEVVELVGKDSTSNPAYQLYGREDRESSHSRGATHLRTANLASGRTPPPADLEEEVKIRRYRSTSCLEPREYKSRMIVSCSSAQPIPQNCWLTRSIPPSRP
jgi:hypothetical protein